MYQHTLSFAKYICTMDYFFFVSLMFDSANYLFITTCISLICYDLYFLWFIGGSHSGKLWMFYDLQSHVGKSLTSGNTSHTRPSIGLPKKELKGRDRDRRPGRD